MVLLVKEKREGRATFATYLPEETLALLGAASSPPPPPARSCTHTLLYFFSPPPSARYRCLA